MPRHKQQPRVRTNRPAVHDAQPFTPGAKNHRAADNAHELSGNLYPPFAEPTRFIAEERQLYEETATVERLISSLEKRLNRNTIEAMLPVQRRKIETLFRRWRAMTLVVMEEVKSKH